MKAKSAGVIQEKDVSHLTFLQFFFASPIISLLKIILMKYYSHTLILFFCIPIDFSRNSNALNKLSIFFA
jgi:hypothetical protein